MNKSYLSLQANILAVRFNHSAIFIDTQYLNEAELISVFSFMIQIQDN